MNFVFNDGDGDTVESADLDRVPVAGEVVAINGVFRVVELVTWEIRDESAGRLSVRVNTVTVRLR